jgi:hypothetical protein
LYLTSLRPIFKISSAVRILVGVSSMVMVMVMVTFDGVFNTVVGFVSD